MGDVTDLDQWVRDRQPHLAGASVCLGCQHTWVAVAPAGTDILECPACHLWKGVFKLLCAIPDQPTWHCVCGNHFVNVLPGFLVFCPACGRTTDAHQ